jgi:formyltetrahydrofolate-dependent phosphoribosylglycinamide formyltransferase (EC 2.1.2.2)
MGKLKVGILISGRGSNMAALVEAAQDPAFPAEVSCVLSNRPDAGGLDLPASEAFRRCSSTTSPMRPRPGSKRR